MSTIVYQGVQSCFESQLIETTILKLKVAPFTNSADNKCHIQEFNKNQENLPLEGFHFMQNIPNIPSSHKEKQSSYIHPCTKTSPRLSQKSLELCTENLGSETGSDDGVDIDILSFNDVVDDSKRDELIREEDKKVALKLESRISKKDGPRNFPPPLTSIRSSNSIQCRTHREDGRLIIEAIELPTRNTYLQAERSDGRLRLSFLNDCDIHFDTDINSNEEYEGDYEDDYVNDDYESDDYIEECYEGEEEAYDDDDDDDDDEKIDSTVDEEIIGNKIEVEGKIGIEKFQRLSRCMESGHANRNLCNWRNSLWVATS